MFVWFVLSERQSVRIGLPTALSQLFLATFGNALCKDVAPIGVFGGVCLQAAARDFQCASVRLGKGLIFDKRRNCRQKQKFFRKYRSAIFALSYELFGIGNMTLTDNYQPMWIIHF